MQVLGLKSRMWSPLVLLALTALFTPPAEGQVSSPRRLRFKVVGSSKLLVSWKEPRGDFEGYRFIYNSEPGGEETEMQISKGQNKAVIHDFSPTKEYTVKVIAVNGDQESRPLKGKYAVQDLEPDEGVQSQKLKDTTGSEHVNEISGAKF